MHPTAKIRRYHPRKLTHTLSQFPSIYTSTVPKLPRVYQCTAASNAPALPMSPPTQQTPENLITKIPDLFFPVSLTTSHSAACLLSLLLFCTRSADHGAVSSTPHPSPHSSLSTPSYPKETPLPILPSLTTTTMTMMIQSAFSALTRSLGPGPSSRPRPQFLLSVIF